MKLTSILSTFLWLAGTASADVSSLHLVGSTNVQAVLTFQPSDDTACTVEVSEDPSLWPLVHDVNPDLFPGSNRDDRDGSMSTGGTRTFVVGRRAVDKASNGKWYSRALQADTVHYFRIRCGDSTATGNFRTANVPVGATYPWPIPQDPQTGNFRWPSVDNDNRNQTIIDPNYGTLIRRITAPGDVDLLSFTAKPFTKASGANWTNSSAALGDDSASAIYSGSGRDWLALTDPGIAFSGAYELGGGIDLATVRVKGSAQGSDDQHRIEICLTLDGASCHGEVRSVTLDSEQSQKTVGTGARIDTWGDTLWPQDVNGNKSFGVLIRPATSGSPISIQYVEIDLAMSEVAGMGVSGNLYTCASVKSNGGYHCSFPGAGGSSANYLFWIHPDTGEVRWLGKMVASTAELSNVQCLSQNALWDSTDPNVYYCGASANGKALLLKGVYTGNDAPATRSAVVQMDWVNLTSSSSVENLVRDLNPNFDPSAYSCSLYTMVNRFAIFTCLRGNQGSIGWIAALDVGNRQPIGQTGTGRVIAAARSFTSPRNRWCGIHSLEPLGNINWIGWVPAVSGEFKVTLQSPLPAATGTFTVQVSGEPSPYWMDTAAGDVFQLTGSPGTDLLRIIRKNSSTEWFVERKVTNADPTPQLTGAPMATYCSAMFANPNTPYVYWNFLEDPSGADATNRTWVLETVLAGSHTVQRGNYRLQSGLNGYEIVTPGAPRSWNQPPSFLVESNPKWAGVRGYVGLEDFFKGRDSYGSHPSYENYQATDPGRNNWFVDDAPFLGNFKLSPSLSPVRAFNQVFRANGTRLHRDALPTFGVCGGRMLREISPGPIRDQDAFTFCVGKDCAPGAAPSDVFVNCPPPVSLSSICSQAYFGDSRQVCIADMVPYGQTITQYFFDRSGLRNRVLTNGLMAFHSPRVFMTLDVASALPDGSWVIFPSFANNARRDLYMVRVPPQPPFDGAPDALSSPIPVTINVTPPGDGGVVDAVPQFGPTARLGLSAAALPCHSGSASCSVTVQAKPGDLVFAKFTFRDASGRAVGDSVVQVQVAGGVNGPGIAPLKPMISRSGVRNAAGLQSNIAPGGIVSVYGDNLASCQAAAGSFPLPSTLCDSQITFSGRPGFFYFASPGQLNVQLPALLPPQQDVQVTVERQGNKSDSFTIPGASVTEVAPAIFSYALGDQLPRAVVQNSDFSLNGPVQPAATSRPLQPGEAATVYANSLGPTNPSVPDGQRAPSGPLAATLHSVDVYINSVRQTLLFSGLAPGLSGLYQVNFMLDLATPPGGTEHGLAQRGGEREPTGSDQPH